MTSSAPRGSAAGLAVTVRSPAPPTPGMVIYDVISFIWSAAGRTVIARSPAPPTPGMASCDVIRFSPGSSMTYRCSEEWTQAPSTPGIAIYDVRSSPGGSMIYRCSEVTGSLYSNYGNSCSDPGSGSDFSESSGSDPGSGSGSYSGSGSFKFFKIIWT